jgi:tubulin polyglutamylase TTLL9
MLVAQFDMRMYALVTSFQPMTIYIYRSGFARFSASYVLRCVVVPRGCLGQRPSPLSRRRHYSNSATDIMNNFVHLTNVAIQKTADNYNPEVRTCLRVPLRLRVL